MKKVLVILILMFLAIFVYSKVDWYATLFLCGFKPENSWAYIVRYWTWQNTFWMLFGLTVAVAYWAGAPSGNRTRIIMILIFVTFGLVTISSLLDWGYFWFNKYAFPPIEEKWTWMPQSWILGLDWGTKQQIQWTVCWLLAIPLMWYITLKYILPRYGK